MAPNKVILGERYVLESPIARGGMGTVWRALDEVLARPVAVKILHDDLAQDEAFVARFKREALSAASLAHPHIVAIYDTGLEERDDEPGQHFIVMELCGGGTLTDLINDEGTPDTDRVIGIGVDICAALSHAHRHDLIHRDVKPANILFTPDGTLKVGDFGIAKAAFGSREITTTGMILGSVTYFSPEQANGDEPDGRSDLYALGVVLYELLTGRPPFQAGTQIATAMMHIRETPPEPRSIRAGIPKRLAAIVMKALEKNPDDRYSSADEFADALRDARRGGGETAVFRTSEKRVKSAKERPVPATAPTTRPTGGRPKWLIPVLLFVVLAVALALFLPKLLDGSDEPGAANGDDVSAEISPIELPIPDDFDPEGDDGEEHPELVRFVVDKKPETVWTTSQYNDFNEKSGVGLLFDLGEPTEVTQIEVDGEMGSFEVRAGDEAPVAGDSLEVVGDEAQASSSNTIKLDEPITARYWLIWITNVPGGGGGSASIGEVRLLGP